MVAAIRQTSGWPLPVQFACTILAIVAAFVVQLPLESRSFGDPFTVFLAAVFIVALMFGLVPGSSFGCGPMRPKTRRSNSLSSRPASWCTS